MELIKVKMIGSDGNVKGRAYTYKLKPESPKVKLKG